MEKAPSANKSIEFTQTDDTLTVVLSGSYPGQEAFAFWEKELKPQLEEKVKKENGGNIVIDVTQIESFSRYGLNFIGFLINRGYHIIIKNPSKQFQSILAQAKADTLTEHITIIPELNIQDINKRLSVILDG